MVDEPSTTIAALALAVSVLSWWLQEHRRRRIERQADLTVMFHWLTTPARVDLRDRAPVWVGYHLVLANNGPAPAADVSLLVRDSKGRELELLDLDPGEFPLTVIDSGSRYPIPWVYEPFEGRARRFEVTLTWTDGRGSRKRTVPLRRGQLPS